MLGTAALSIVLGLLTWVLIHGGRRILLQRRLLSRDMLYRLLTDWPDRRSRCPGLSIRGRELRGERLLLLYSGHTF
jgi:hypothetical protein